MIKWKVIANSPLSPYKIGDIVEQSQTCDTIPFGHYNIIPENYPAIFKKIKLK